MDRETALNIVDRLTPLGVNVVVVVVADPLYGQVDPETGEPTYQVELSRNNALNGEKITEMIAAVSDLGAQIEFPNMTVYTDVEVEARNAPMAVPEAMITPNAPTETLDAVDVSPTPEQATAAGHDPEG